VSLPIANPASLVSWYEASTDEVRVVGETSRLPTSGVIVDANGVPCSSANRLPVSSLSTILGPDGLPVAAANRFQTATQLVDEAGTPYGVKHLSNMPLVLMYGKTGDATYQAPRIDTSTHSLQTVSYPHHEIHGGSHYFVVGYADVANTNVLDFQWTMPAGTKWSHWTWTIDTEDEVTWLVYENAVVSNPLANTMTLLNSNRNSANTSGTTMRWEIQGNLAAANGDTDVTAPAILMESGKTKGGGPSKGGSASRDDEIVLAADTVYCLRAIAGAAGFINFSMFWYEHTDKTA
jgi:hypothetical protein